MPWKNDRTSRHSWQAIGTVDNTWLRLADDSDKGNVDPKYSRAFAGVCEDVFLCTTGLPNG